MISLTRLNGEVLVLNSDLIRYAEANPDTVITLVTGEKIVVAESCADLISRIMEYRRELLRAAFPEPKVQTSIDPGVATRGTAISTKIASGAVETLNTKNETDAAESDKSWRRRQRETD